MGVYTQPSGNWLSRRGAFLVLLIAFHLLFFWALKSGLAVKFVEKVLQPIKAEIINEVIPEEPPPPPPEVQMELPPVQVPPILVDIQMPPPPQTAIQAPITTESLPPAPPAPPTVTRSVVRTRVGYAYKPDTNDYYPSTSRNLGEEGLVKLTLCYGTDGKVDKDRVTVAESSGHARLDDAALRMGPRFRIKPATVDGKPEADCVAVPVRFSLKGEE